MKHLVILGFALILSPTWAMTSTMTSGHILPSETFALVGEAQIITTRPHNGGSLIAHTHYGFNESINFIGSLGLGTNTQVGAKIKWIPFPDYENQPALGLIAGFNYSTFTALDDIRIYMSPIISKEFVIPSGSITPYTSLPISLSSQSRPNNDREIKAPIRLAFGSELNIDAMEGWILLSEVGLNISDSLTYISIGAKYTFDKEL